MNLRYVDVETYFRYCSRDGNRFVCLLNGNSKLFSWPIEFFKVERSWRTNDCSRSWKLRYDPFIGSHGKTLLLSLLLLLFYFGQTNSFSEKYFYDDYVFTAG
jgi:hypothetical protein